MQILTDKELLQFTGKQESQFIIKPSGLLEDIRARLSSDGTLKGDLLPWSKTHKCVALRPGEVSLWCGINGHGKSQLLGQVCAWNLEKSRWLIASMEMLPAATMERMTKQTAGCNPSDEYLNQFLKWTDDRLWLYDQTDTVKMEKIFAIIYYAAEVLKVNHVAIDSLMKCGIKKDDLEGQAFFVDKLCWAAKATGCHVHLVHHVRKGDKESRVPDKFDVRGAGEITDLVDNLFIIHRNKGKEEKIRLKKDVSEDEPDCILVVAKQRHGEWEGQFQLWFHPESKQYLPKSDNRVMGFVI